MPAQKQSENLLKAPRKFLNFFSIREHFSKVSQCNTTFDDFSVPKIILVNGRHFCSEVVFCNFIYLPKNPTCYFKKFSSILSVFIDL